MYIKHYCLDLAVAIECRVRGDFVPNTPEEDMNRKYQSGTFCMDIRCERHKPLEVYKGDEYLEKKA